MLLKVAAVQHRAGSRLSLAERMFIFKQRPDLVCLPEYALLGDTAPDYHRAALQSASDLEYLVHLSDELSCTLVAGTVVESDGDQLFNTCHVARKGHWIGSYRKRHPVDRELQNGISPGSGNLVLQIDGVRIGIMICGDVFFPSMYDEMRDAGVDILCIPTTSPFREHDTILQKQERDRSYFLSGSRASGAFVVKVCSVGTMLGRPLQGRSLIAAPWGMLEQVDVAAEQKTRIMTATLDITELREFRIKQSIRAAMHGAASAP